ncbi:MAG: prepilin-type N-terminal cleavage/methylation domain-containing protein [Planctomycetota bacterium]|jgi:prepilin-type processing-associated H-X9-DG protein/prepilin-type N-terminal cleavage/methylation domain-containing protein
MKNNAFPERRPTRRVLHGFTLVELLVACQPKALERRSFCEGGWRRPIKKEFTLVELLVVIAIISILAGMLLPALENALNAADAIKCQNNLKQVSFSFMQYADSYDGFLPSYYDKNDIYYSYWPAKLLRDSETGGSIFWCPSMASGTQPNFWEKDSQSDADAYTNNAAFKYPAYGMNYTFVKASGTVLTAVPKLSGFSSSSSTILAADTYQTGIDGRGSWWLLGYPNFASGKGQLAARHSGAVNTLFVDGHAASYHLGLNDPVEKYSASYNAYLMSPFDTYWLADEIVWHPKK